MQVLFSFRISPKSTKAATADSEAEAYSKQNAVQLFSKPFIEDTDAATTQPADNCFPREIMGVMVTHRCEVCTMYTGKLTVKVTKSCDVYTLI